MMWIPVVDSHHHFWRDPSTDDYPWMTDELESIRQTFGPDELRPLLADTGVDATILVQTRSSLAESYSFLELAARIDFICGVIGWVDLTGPGVADTIQHLRCRPGGEYLVGIRHQVHDEPDPKWLLRKDVSRGLQAVSDAGLVYDLLVRPRELHAALKVAEQFPHLRLVVDHIAKPNIREGTMDDWATGLSQLSQCSNVACKLSGMITEADWSQWTPADFAPYVKHVVESFGPERLLFGSDWPVCLLAGSYQAVFDICRSVVNLLPKEAGRDVFGGNAMRLYRPPATDPHELKSAKV